MACINCGWTGIGCPGQWWLYRCTLDNNLTMLPAPGYIPTQVDDCFNGTAGTAYSHGLWDGFCIPPPSPYPISTGPYQADIMRGPVSTGGEIYIDRGFSLACRITPTALCMPYINIHNVYNLLAGKKTIVEIRKNNPSANLPMGIPGDNNIFGKFIIEFSVPTTVYDGWGNPWNLVFNSSVPIDAILDAIDEPVWATFYSEDYQCTNAFVGTGYRRLQLKRSDTPTNNVAIFSESTGCTWQLDTTGTIPSIALASYKSSICDGTIVINDFGFSKMPSTYLDDNCFSTRSSIEGQNVAIGITYTNPHPARSWRLARISYAYQKPDFRYVTGFLDIPNVNPGQHEVFIEMNDKYMPGKYTDLSVTGIVITV